MYRVSVIIGKISRFALKGVIFNNDRRSIHYPTYYMATCQNEKDNFTQCLLKTLLGLISYRTTCGVIRET